MPAARGRQSRCCRSSPGWCCAGDRIEPDLEDLVVDGLDVPLVATIGDDRRLAAEVTEGLPPGARGRGDVVRAADELLLRLTDQAVAA